MKQLFLLLSTFCWLSFSGDHALYFSVMELQIDKEGNANLMVKCFNDDLQDALKNWNEYQFDIDELKQQDQKQISAYLKDKIVFTQNEKILNLELVEASIEGETTWLSFQSSIKYQESFSISATQLMELFPQQKQMLRIKGPNKKSHHILSLESSSEEFSGF